MKITLKQLKDDARRVLYKYNMGEHSSTVIKFTDGKLIQEFIEFHNKNTHLRIVTKAENLSELKSK